MHPFIHLLRASVLLNAAVQQEGMNEMSLGTERKGCWVRLLVFKCSLCHFLIVSFGKLANLSCLPFPEL